MTVTQMLLTPNARVWTEERIEALERAIDSLGKRGIVWKEYSRDTTLRLRYASQFIPSSLSRELLQYFEAHVKYLQGEAVKLKVGFGLMTICYDLHSLRVFNKWHAIPRKHVAYGDEGMSYTFSSTTVPALQWNRVLARLRDRLNEMCDEKFNFVLVNRYNDGNDYIGAHV